MKKNVEQVFTEFSNSKGIKGYTRNKSKGAVFAGRFNRTKKSSI